MKNVVVINGSPRPDGYTMKMVKIFEEELKEIDRNIELDYIHLIKKDVKQCLGCCKCLAVGGENCPIQDDIPEILEEMRNADALVFAAPGYAQMVPGLYKNFMDRFMYLDHLNDLRLIGKTAVIISTSGGERVNRPAKYMANMGVTWWGCNVTDIVGIASAFFVMNERYKHKTEKRLRSVAEKFHAELNREKPRRPNFRQYFYFMYNKLEIQTAGETMPARFTIWKKNNWLKTDYYYKTFVNPLYKMVGTPLFALVKLIQKVIMGDDFAEKGLEYMNGP